MATTSVPPFTVDVACSSPGRGDARRVDAVFDGTMTAHLEAAEELQERRALRRLLRSLYSTDSYGTVLVLIVLTYVVAVTTPGRSVASLVLLVQIGTVWLALRISGARPLLRGVATGLMVVAGVGAIVGLASAGDETLDSALFLAASALYVVAPASIVRHIGYRRVIDQETMLGALAAYLFFGMAFAFIYRALGAMQAGPFFGPQGEGDLADDLFFSFVTLTTTGYGNLVPEGNPGQSLSVLEALLGQLFLVTAVAKVVNGWRPRAWGGADIGPRPDSQGQPHGPPSPPATPGPPAPPHQPT